MILCSDEDFKDPDYISQFEQECDIVKENIDIYLERPLLLSAELTGNRVDAVNYNFYKYEIPLRVYYDIDIKRLFLGEKYALDHDASISFYLSTDKVEKFKRIVDYLSVYDEIYIEEKHSQLQVNSKCRIEDPLTHLEIASVGEMFNAKFDKVSSYGTYYGDGYRYIFKFNDIEEYEIIFTKIIGNTFINYEIVLSGATHFSYKEKDIQLTDFLEKVKKSMTETLVKDYERYREQNTDRSNLINLFR